MDNTETIGESAADPAPSRAAARDVPEARRRPPARSRATTAARAVHVLVWLLALVPLAQLIADGALGRLGANPIEAITHRTGKAALVLLVATLCVSPVRRLLRWNALIRVRRPLGVFAFGYATLHLLIYVGLDHFFDWRIIVEDVAKRPFVTSGFAALVLLAPLAATSTRGMMRRLGPRWQRLHRLVYPAAALAVLHYFWKVKADTREPLIYAAVLALLLAVRLLPRRGRPRARAGRPR